jgi:hypothetical protein
MSTIQGKDTGILGSQPNGPRMVLTLAGNQPQGTAPAIDPSSLPESLRHLHQEIATYRRELPRLLAEGQEGRVALVRGDQIVSIWDTFQDAYQAGRGQFDLEAFLAQPVDSRDLDRIVFGPCPAPQQP